MSALEKEVASSTDRASRSPSQPAAVPPSVGSSFEGKMLRRLLGVVGNPPVEFVLWTGERITTHPAPTATVRVADRATLLGLAKDPHIRFGDAYSEGKITIDGDLLHFLELMYRAAPKEPKAVRTISSFLKGG